MKPKKHKLSQVAADCYYVLLAEGDHFSSVHEDDIMSELRDYAEILKRMEKMSSVKRRDKIKEAFKELEKVGFLEKRGDYPYRCAGDFSRDFDVEFPAFQGGAG